MIPTSSLHQYDRRRWTFPKNSIRSHVAGNVEIRKMTSAANNARIMSRPCDANATDAGRARAKY